MKISYYCFTTLILASLLFACGKSDTPKPEPEKPDKTVELTAIEASDITFLLGQEHNVVYKLVPTNATHKEVEITSEDASIVSVNGQKLNALKLGTTNVVIKSKSTSVSTTFNVRVLPVGSNKITLNKGELKLYIGQKETLAAFLLPSNVTDKTIVWTSKDPTIATVNASGTIEAIKLGTTEVTASSADGNVKATAQISVLEDTDFITGTVKFKETTQDGKKSIEMETRMDNLFGSAITILQVEAYADGKLTAIDLSSFTKTIEAGKLNQYINTFTGALTTSENDYQATWYTKVYFSFNGMIYCLTTKKDQMTIVKIQGHTIGINPDWDGKSTTEF